MAGVVLEICELKALENICPAGLVHSNMAPTTSGVFNCNKSPAHNGPLLVGVGVVGYGLTTTSIVAGKLGQVFTVTEHRYWPPAAAEAAAILGFCSKDVKPFGPLQLYDPPGVSEAVRFITVPSQIGPLLPNVGAAGDGNTNTLVVAKL